MYRLQHTCPPTPSLSHLVKNLFPYKPSQSDLQSHSKRRSWRVRVRCFCPVFLAFYLLINFFSRAVLPMLRLIFLFLMCVFIKFSRYVTALPLIQFLLHVSILANSIPQSSCSFFFNWPTFEKKFLSPQPLCGVLACSPRMYVVTRSNATQVCFCKFAAVAHFKSSSALQNNTETIKRVYNKSAITLDPNAKLSQG